MESEQCARREKENWYRDLVEHSDDLLCIHDLAGRLLSVNSAPALALGYSVEELLQIPMRELVAPEYRSQFDAYLVEIERVGEVRGFLAIMARSGERRIWQYHNALCTEGVASPIVRGVAHDITDQRRTEKLLRQAGESLLSQVREHERSIRKLQLFRTLLDQSNDAVEVVDPDSLRFLDVNDKACSALGYGREELLCLTVFDIDPEITPSSIGQIREHLRTTGSLVVESLRRRKDRSIFPVEVSMKSVQLEREYVIAIVQDITARKAADARLQEYERVVEGQDEMIVVVDREHRYVIANRAFLDYRGLERQQVVGHTIDEIVHAQALEVVKQKMDECFQGKIVEYEMKYTYPNRGERDLFITYFPMEGPTGVERIAAILRDVTQTKRAEEARHRSELALRDAKEFSENLIRTANVIILGLDMEGNVNLFNQAAEEITGYAFSELIGGSWSTVVPRDRFPEVWEEFDKLLGGKAGPTYENPILTKTGEQRHISWRNNQVKVNGTVVGTISFGIDITEHKLAEQALQHSEQNYGMFIAQSSEGIFRQDLDEPLDVNAPEDELIHHILHDSYVAECNEAFVKMYGLNSVQEFAGKRLTETLDPNDPRNIDLTRDYVRSGFRIIDRESHETDVHGNPKVFLNSLIGIVESGKLVQTWGIQRDITERVKLEEARQNADEALRKSESHFRLLVEQASDGIFLADAQGRYLDVNSAGLEMLGYSRAEILQLSIADIVAGEEVARVPGEVARFAGGNVVRTEWKFRRKNGSFFPGEVVGRQLPDGRLQAILRDMTERQEAEEALNQTVRQLRAVTTELELTKEKLSEEKLYLENAIDTELGFGEIIGHSGALQEVMKKVAKVASTNSTVLLLGETGTGKELVARALHHFSKRKQNSFIKLNCAAIPSGLLESELFGHEKGAFTGAVSKKFGRLELADKGTLFLDEIGEIPLGLQPKLLRVLQDQEFERLGGTQTLKVDFRLIAATNRDLLRSVNESQFRSDLYYRLNVFPIRIPPLRERREDIPLLVDYFVQRYSARMDKSITSIPARTMERLVQWGWPGNIRELENFIERSVILTPGLILQVPLSELGTPPNVGNAETLHEKNRERIVQVLRECKGQLGGPAGAAVRLGLKRTTLQSKLVNFGIDPGDYRGPTAGKVD
ncbi:MAG: PAS domain S-box protein [Candidatus Sulfotelmatobacter sp.]